ncbi:MAG TPA: ABC transporter ATP-binding protein [Clostridiaceae bacterium]|nr:ABC transporter ATP-binding protein [Clostridiaceae bacterium]
MLKLFRHLKSFSLYILLIVLLLFLQAVCDLSLPDYMSDIVNVGIQQGGIDSAVPQVIRESEYKKLNLLLSDEENNLFVKGFRLLSKDSLSSREYETFVEKYPVLEKENIYLINTSDKLLLEDLNRILGRRLLVLYMIEKGMPAEGNMSFGNMSLFEGFQGLPSSGFPSGADPFDILSKLPKEQLEGILKIIDGKIDQIPEKMITQSSIAYITDEYQSIGVDTARLQRNYILKVGGLMLGIALIGAFATVLVSFLSAKVAAGLGRNIRETIFRKVTSFSNSEFDKFSTASLITRSTNDIQQVQILMTMLFRVVFYAPILGIGGVIRALSNNYSMGWIIAVGVMAILTLVVVLSSIALPKFKSVQKLVDRVNLVIRESLTGMLVIRAFNNEKFQENKFDESNRNLTRTNLFISRLMAIMMPAMMLIMNGLILLIIWVGAHQVDYGNIQVGDMMAFMQYTMQIIMSFLMISMVSIMLPRAAVSAQRILEVTECDVLIKDPENPVSLGKGNRCQVQFKNVSFKYPGAEEFVLYNINFTANPGETTAIIGSTGSGKSTLINLIPRFYDVTEGEILIDGVNIKNITQKDLREKIGFVPQKGILFSGTIESNIKYGGDNISDQDMIKAARIAQSEEFIREKEGAYDFIITQGGTNVSGGQRQRLTIARALAKNPGIYIFDDSFSALDFKTDRALRKSLKEEIKGCTVIIVAQRISTIMDADKIIVLDEGRIVGEGTHKELLKTCEIYKEIAYSQLSKEELEYEQQ